MGEEIERNLRNGSAQLKDVIEESSTSSITSIVARSYIKSGDFWSDADKRFTIDSSWMPKVALAVDWYDRVIAEYPNSNAAEIAHKKKISTLN